jgi:hypothetical protein
VTGKNGDVPDWVSPEKKAPTEENKTPSSVFYLIVWGLFLKPQEFCVFFFVEIFFRAETDGISPHRAGFSEKTGPKVPERHLVS